MFTLPALLGISTDIWFFPCRTAPGETFGAVWGSSPRLGSRGSSRGLGSCVAGPTFLRRSGGRFARPSPVFFVAPQGGHAERGPRWPGVGRVTSRGSPFSIFAAERRDSWAPAVLGGYA
jgi:hypothetical protein